MPYLLLSSFLCVSRDSFGKAFFLINLLFYSAFMLNLTIYIADSTTGSSQKELTNKNTEYQLTREQHYIPVHTIDCNHTDAGHVHFIYLSGHSGQGQSKSRAFSTNPCRSIQHVLSCRNRAVGRYTLLTASRNTSCTAELQQKSHFLACNTTNTSYLSVYEVAHNRPKLCSAFAYNSTCELKSDQLGVVYSDINNITAFCHSPYAIPVS